MTRVLALAVMIAVCVLPVTIMGHPLSTYGAQLNISGDQIRVIINADLVPWVMKLDAIAGRASPAPASVARVDGYRDLIESRSIVRADGQVVPLMAGPARINADGQVELTLTATLPSSTEAVTWSSGLIFGTYPVSVTYGANPTESLLWVEGTAETDPVSVAAAGGHQAAFGRYTVLGFQHILPKGLDHILFIVGLFLLTSRFTALLAQVSVFTLAHSISLGLAISGVVTLPSSIVEPLIALSIAYVGVENLFRSTMSRRRLWLIGAFGLLHGLGFAGVLAELSLPADQWWSALAGFNVGVEVGQLAVIALAAVAMATWRLVTKAPDDVVRRFASLGIAAMGVFWVVTRIQL